MSIVLGRKKKGKNYNSQITGHIQMQDIFTSTGIKGEDILLSVCYHFLGFIIWELFLYQDKVSAYFIMNGFLVWNTIYLTSKTVHITSILLNLLPFILRAE